MRRWTPRRPSTRATAVANVGRYDATTALNEYLDWPGVAQVGEVTCQVDRDGKRTEATRYFITSVPRKGRRLPSSRMGRGHWSIENRSHYVRDVTMGEDANRTRKGSGPQVMAAFRNAAIGFLRSTGATNIAADLRNNPYHVKDLFAKLGILKQSIERRAGRTPRGEHLESLSCQILAPTTP